MVDVTSKYLTFNKKVQYIFNKKFSKYLDNIHNEIY